MCTCMRACLWLCSSFFSNLLTIRSRNSFFFVKHPPLNFFLCDYLLLYLGYYCLLYHVECDVAFSSDGILYRYDTLIQHKNERYPNSITSVENAFFIVLCIIHQWFKDWSCIYNMQSQGCRSLIFHLINRLIVIISFTKFSQMC